LMFYHCLTCISLCFWCGLCVCVCFVSRCACLFVCFSEYTWQLVA
jgi:hypothetical protein